MGLLIGEGLQECTGPHATLLSEVRDLVRRQKQFGQILETGRWLVDLETIDPKCRGGILVYGVWVEDSLYYEALGVPLGVPPAGREDARDRFRGIPESAFGRCGRCRMSWKWVKSHSTEYSASGGMFPLCERCWSELSPGDRVPFYRELWDGWQKTRNEYPTLEATVGWESVRAAVMAGK